MEFSVREWTIIVGVLLIVAVFLDGYRRVRNERSNRIRVTLSRQVFNHQPAAPTEPVDLGNPELPGGGARVIAKRRADELKLHHAAPVLIEPVAIAPVPQPEPTPQAQIQPQSQFAYNTPADTGHHAPHHPEPRAQQQSVASEPIEDSEDIWSDHADAARIEPEFDAFSDAAEEFQADAEIPEIEEVIEPEPAPRKSFFSSRDTRPVIDEYDDARAPDIIEPQEVLIVNVLSKDARGFNGADLLQLLLACDLRFGSMNIFHRYEKANGKGPIQFSVANLVEPGSFNLDAIDSLTTPGVTFFLTLPGPEKPVTAFNYMVETAQVLVRHLQAELRDDAQSVMTAQTIEHCRQRIRDFERKQLTLQL